MRRALILLTLLACSVILGAAAAQAAPENAVSAAARARIVIGLQRTDQAGEVARSVDARILRRLVALRLVAATVDEDRRNEVLARLRSDPRVRYAELDRRVRVVPPLIGRRLQLPLARSSRTPNDEGFSVQYGLRDSGDSDIEATNAWDSQTACPKVGVLDSGIQTGHPDLKSNMWTNDGESNNGIDDDGNGFVDDHYGIDLIQGKNSGKDPHGHGTHVAGIIAAKGNNTRGVAGVCWKAKLMNLRFMDSHGGGYTTDAATAIVYAVRHGVHVINASYGSYKPSDGEKDAIAYAQRHDTLIVAAAGNDSEDSDQTPSYPADYDFDNIISVAASTSSDRLASFSNFGNRSVDLAAPGVEIGSTWKGSDYRYMSGTSMATPFVTATAAMLRKAGDGISYTRIRNLILNNVDRKGAFSSTTVTGGRLNAARALADI